MKKIFRAHPLMIFETIKPFLLILIIPVIRGTVQYIRNGEIEKILGFETVVFCAVVVYAICRWLTFRLICGEKTVTVRDGIFLIRRAVIPVSGLSSVQSEQSPLDYIFRSVTFRINTEAGSRRKTDYSFKLSRTNAHKVSELLYGEKIGEPIRFSPIKIAILSVATSSALGGLLVGVPILNATARLAGLGVTEVMEQINAVSNKFETYFPPIVNTATFILLCSFGVSFIYSFFKYLKFRIFLNDDRIEVRSGLFVMTRTSFKKSSVNNIKIEQTPIMLFFRRYALKVNVGGYGEAKSESQVLVPCGKYKELKSLFSDYFPFLQTTGTKLESKRGAVHLNRYYYWAEMFALALIGLALYFGIRFEEFSRLVVFATFVCGAILLYYTYLCYCEYKNCCAEFGDSIFARGKKGLRKCRFYCPKDRVGEIKLIRYPPDSIFKTCNVQIITRSETADNIIIRHLDYEDAKREIYKCYGIIE